MHTAPSIFFYTHPNILTHAHQGGSKLSCSSVTHNMLSPTGKFCIHLGAGSSSQALGQQTQRALLALVLEQYPLPDEQTHTMAAALDCMMIRKEREEEHRAATEVPRCQCHHSSLPYRVYVARTSVKRPHGWAHPCHLGFLGWSPF